MSGRGETTEEPSSRASAPSQANVTDQQKRKSILNVVYLITALDITCMFLQVSVTPYLARKLGFDTLWFGYLQTMVGVVQLIGGPMFGRFGDLFGARAALSLACSATVVFFLLLAIAESPAMLFIHKLPTVFMHALPASQMVVADLTEPEKRADALSKLGLCFGIGIIAGSMLGGNLNTRYGETFTACFGAAGSAFNLLLVLKFIPKTTKSQAPRTNKDGAILNTSKVTWFMQLDCIGLHTLDCINNHSHLTSLDSHSHLASADSNNSNDPCGRHSHLVSADSNDP